MSQGLGHLFSRSSGQAKSGQYSNIAVTAILVNVLLECITMLKFQSYNDSFCYNLNM